VFACRRRSIYRGNNAEGVVEVPIAMATVNDLTWKDFRDAVYRVLAEERKDCCWFLDETVLNDVANIEDSTGCRS